MRPHWPSCSPVLALLPTLLGSIALGPGCEGDTLVAQAELEVSPERLDFGAVATGEVRTLTLTLRNRSPSAELVVSRIALAEGTAAAFTLGDVPSTLAPGAEATVAVRYRADDGEPDAGHVHVETNARNAPRILVPVESSRTSAAIRVVPDRLDMGNLAAGQRVERSLDVENGGLDTLRVTRASLRTSGFQGEACREDGDCREGRCAPSISGPLCALDCATTACPGPWSCQVDALGDRCVEGARAPRLVARGFTVPADPGVLEVPPGGRTTLTLGYAPGIDDRGAAQLALESNDPERPFLIVPLLGRPDDLPPVAAAARAAPIEPTPLPGARIGVDGRASYDPEGGALTYRWSFARRPEGSRATIAAATSATTTFTVDLPGAYAVALEVRDTGGLASSNAAQVAVDVAPGARVRVVLRWDREDTDLDLHLVRPGAAVGSVGDCHFDNPTPDWPPAGPTGDPALAAAPREEIITLTAPADGTYTAVVTVAGASPQGATAATVTIEYESVEVARYEATLAAPTVAWDVATLSRPSGRVTALGTLR